MKLQNTTYQYIIAICSLGLLLVIAAPLFVQHIADAQSGALSNASNRGNACERKWVRNRAYGDIGTDVRRLQQFLNANTQTQLGASGPGSVGRETRFFGVRTRAAVSDFQALYADRINKENPVNGMFDGPTRQVVNEICGNTRSDTKESINATSTSQSGDTTHELQSLQLQLNKLQIKLMSLQQQKLADIQRRLDNIENNQNRLDEGRSSGSTEVGEDNSRSAGSTEGEIEDFTIQGTGNQNIRENTQQHVIGFSFTARESDITLKRVDLVVKGVNQRNERRPWRLIENIILKRGDGRVDTEVADEAFQWNQIGDDVYRFRLSVDERIQKDTSATFDLAFNTREAIDSNNLPQDFKIGLANNTNDDDGIRLLTEGGVQHYYGSTKDLTKLRFVGGDSQGLPNSSQSDGNGISGRSDIYGNIQLFD